MEKGQQDNSPLIFSDENEKNYTLNNIFDELAVLKSLHVK